MTKSQILGAVRHALTFGGGYLVAKGFVTSADLSHLPSQLDTVLSGLQTAVGALSGLLGLGWSIWEKIDRPGATAAAAPVDMGRLAQLLGNARKDIAALGAPSAKVIPLSSAQPAAAAALPPKGPAGFIAPRLLGVLAIIGLAIIGVMGCSTTSSATGNANVAPVITSAVQAAATYALAEDPTLKPDLQTALQAMQGLQIAGIVVTPAVITTALDKALTTFGSSVAHITYLNNLLAPYLADIATDLPDAMAGLNAALNPPSASPATSSPPITTSTTVAVPAVLIQSAAPAATN